MDDDSADEKRGMLCWVLSGKIPAIQLPEKVVDDHNQILARFTDRLSFQEGRLLGIEVVEFARLRLFIVLRFTLKAFLDRLLDLGQGLETALQHLESLVGTVMRSKFLKPGTF
ncbi:MAG: hypothetical protein DU481_14360 [Nitrosomonas sp.]